MVAATLRPIPNTAVRVQAHLLPISAALVQHKPRVRIHINCSGAHCEANARLGLQLEQRNGTDAS
jgi:hypothetical protein